LALWLPVVEGPGGTRLWVLYEEGAYHRSLALVPDADMRRLVADYQELAVLSALRTGDPELLNRTVDQVPWSSTRARTAMSCLSK
jgi:hypothetical protein